MIRALVTALSIIILLRAELAFGDSLSLVSTFGYQLQILDREELRDAPFSLMVIDYSVDGSQRGAFAAEGLTAIRSGNNKKLLAYLSIGEAEEYRYYFKRRWVTRVRGATCGRRLSGGAPSWLDDPNPDWCGNYKVRFWDRRWKRIIFGVRSGRTKSYLDRILDAGFDGVYLDIIDGYEYWQSEKKPASARRKTAARDMARFVTEIARYARVTRGRSGFIVVPQNGAAIIDEVSVALRAEYLAAIDAIGAEDTFFFGPRDEDNALNPQTRVIALLDQYVAAGKKVFAIDYLLDPGKVTQFLGLACAHGYIPQVSNRVLDTLSKHSLASCAVSRSPKLQIASLAALG